MGIVNQPETVILYQFYKKPRLDKRGREMGLVVNAWTVNNSDTMDSLLDQQIDFITTYKPELLLDKLRETQY